MRSDDRGGTDPRALIQESCLPSTWKLPQPYLAKRSRYFPVNKTLPKFDQSAMLCPAIALSIARSSCSLPLAVKLIHCRTAVLLRCRSDPDPTTRPCHVQPAHPATDLSEACPRNDRSFCDSGHQSPPASSDPLCIQLKDNESAFSCCRLELRWTAAIQPGERGGACCGDYALISRDSWSTSSRNHLYRLTDSYFFAVSLCHLCNVAKSTILSPWSRTR